MAMSTSACFGRQQRTDIRTGRLLAIGLGEQVGRVYESIEGDLRISARHDGRIGLNVVLWESAVAAGWRVEADVRLGP